MKNKQLTVGVISLAIGLVMSTPLLASAHGSGMMSGSAQTPYQMMEFVEDEALGNDEIHEEMEELMVKMMTGAMSEEEANRMIALMDEYPAVSGMMMNRMLAFQSLGDGGMNSGAL